MNILGIRESEILYLQFGEEKVEQKTSSKFISLNIC